MGKEEENQIGNGKVNTIIKNGNGELIKMEITVTPKYKSLLENSMEQLKRDIGEEQYNRIYHDAPDYGRFIENAHNGVIDLYINQLNISNKLAQTVDNLQEKIRQLTIQLTFKEKEETPGVAYG